MRSFLERFNLALTLALIALVSLPVLALAQATIPDPAADLGVFLSFVLDAVQGKQWGIVGAAIGIGLVSALKFGGVKLPGALGSFFASSRGGAVLALATALATGLGAAVVAHTPITIGLVLNLLLQGFAMIGGWVGVRRLLGLDVASKAAASFQPSPTTTAGGAAAALGKPPAV